MRSLFTLVLVFVMAARASAGTRLENWHDAARDRDVPAKLYLPEPLAADTPVVVFSPGLGGSRDGYGYLGQAWSAHGYAVVVLTHVGSDLKHILDPSALTAAEYFARVADVKFALDQLQKIDADPADALSGKLKLDHVAMAGHSYGGHTTQALAGQVGALGVKTVSLGDPRIACAIIMSPSPPANGPAPTAFAKIAIPLLHLTGTEDDSPIGNVKAKDRRVPFDACPFTPQWLVTFKNADHMTFSGRPGRTAEKTAVYGVVHPLILQTTIEFLDAELRHDATAAAWMQTKLTATVGAAGVVESK